MGRTTQEKYLERTFNNWLRSTFEWEGSVKGPAHTNRGVPDRIIVLPKQGGTIWVEFKGDLPSYKFDPESMQGEWMRMLQESNPNRYFFVETAADLVRLKQACLVFMSIGQQLNDYEKNLFDSINVVNDTQNE